MIFPVVSTIRRICGYQMPRLGPQIAGTLMRSLPQQMEVELFPGIHCRINRDDEAQLGTWWLGRRFEKPTIDVFSHWLGQGATTFFDIGANYGFYSHYIASKYKNTSIYAFEPDPTNYENLVNIAKRNKLTAIKGVNIALGDKEDKLTLYTTDSNTGGAKLVYVKELERHNHETQVDVLSFDQWIAREGLSYPDQPQWIAKIDVEGFEPRVLRGMSKALEAKAFMGIAVEVLEHTLRFAGFTPNDISTALGDYGYIPAERVGGIHCAPGTCLNSFYIPKP